MIGSPSTASRRLLDGGGMSDTYDTDIALWSVHQAELLRRMAKGERVNDQVDWENVAEEIEDMGNNVVRGAHRTSCKRSSTI